MLNKIQFKKVKGIFTMTTTITKLWNKNFFLFVTGMELSLIGNALLRFVLPLYILLETGDPALMGTVTALASIPLIAFLPIGGLAADRLNKRVLFAVMNFATAIAIIVYFGISNVMDIVPATIIFMLFFSAFESMITPSTEASVPALVPADDLVKANSVTWLLSIFSTVGSPILGGFILARFGLIPILFVSIALYLLATIVKLMVQIPYTKQKMDESLLKTIVKDLKDAIYFVTKENTEIGKLMLTSIFVGFFLLPVTYVALPVLASTYLGMGETIVGVMQGSVMFGGTLGVILIGVLGEKANITKARLFLLICSTALLLSGLGFMLSSNVKVTSIILIVSFFTVMIFFTIFAIIASAYMGEKIPEHLIGKVMSLDVTIIWLATAAGNYIFGLLFSHFINSPGIALLIIGGFATAGALCVRIRG